jgi:hypothetical protein
MLKAVLLIRMFLGRPIRNRHYLYGSGCFHQQAKKVKRTLISNIVTSLRLFIFED